MNGAARFWAKVQRGEGCWLWIAYRNAHGYGKVRWNGKAERAHRVAWELERGPIPEGMQVLHSCDTPACVRPDHLHLGTHADNMKELFDRRRRVSSEEKNNAWKLTAAQVREIRSRYAAGGTSHRALGREYGVTAPYIGQIVRGQSWQFLAEDAAKIEAYIRREEKSQLKMEKRA